MIFEASATATSTDFTNVSRVVTGSATAYATSTISYEDAYNQARRTAVNVSNDVTNTQVSLINTATNTVFVVSSLEDSLSSGTLRDCIIQSNKLLRSRITFAVSGIIYLESSLPSLISQVIIDGTTAPTYESNNLPVVTIDGKLEYNTIVVEQNNNGCLINSIAIQKSIQNGITINSNNNAVINCYIAQNLQNGIYLNCCNNNTIGELKYSNYTNQKIASNTISGNGANGVYLYFASNNSIGNNNIGTDYSGNVAFPNTQSGIFLSSGSDYNTIGGPISIDANGVVNNPTGSKGTISPVFVIPPLGNLISGNIGNGITLEGSSNTRMYGNFIGTTYDGRQSLGNKKNGIVILNSSYTKLYGCSINDQPFVYYNVISGNSLNGILIEYSEYTTIQGNFIGTSSHNNAIVGNGLDGLFVGRAANNILLGGIIPLGNVVSGNFANGIYLSEDSSGFETYNTFGGLFAFGGAAPNQKNGMLIDKESSNHIIGKNSARTNIFSGNTENGVEIRDDASDINIEAIICGATTNGDVALPNEKNGIFIHGNVTNITIGNKINSIIFKSVISGNKEHGIVISDNSNNNKIYNCNIGTNIAENLNIGNGKSGILIDNFSNANIISNLKNTKNVIVNNGTYGVELGPIVKENIITNNYLGINQLYIAYPNKLGNFNLNYDPSNKTDPNYTS